MTLNKNLTKVKLIIWDLDETFWKGTLSEEGVEIVQSNIDLVKNLTSRGIINSISSKNDPKLVNKKLIEIGMIDYFVFKKIGWFSKGLPVQDTLNQMNLRAENTLFIDDNKFNLNEVASINPGISCLTVEELYEIKDKPAFNGKDDSNHSRLNQYKHLETRINSKKDYDSDENFLKKSGIKVSIYDAEINHKERIFELIERTNQLNFTKKRITIDETENLLNSSEYKNLCVHAVDNYGDYGMIGFVSISLKDNVAEHFIFSCRILNLGIESAIYYKIGEPKLFIQQPVASTLLDFSPDWVKFVSIKDQTLSREIGNSFLNSLVFRGGCDLSQAMQYLSKSLNIIDETNYVSNENVPIHIDHSMVILGQVDNIQKLPFLPEKKIKSKIFDKKNDVVISVLMDFTQDLYQDKNDGSIIPIGGYQSKSYYQQFSGEVGKIIDNFFENSINIGQISEEDFYNNLILLREKLGKDQKLFILNGAEIRGSVVTDDEFARHISMNKVVDKFIKNHENTYLIDIRNIVLDESDLVDSIRHYKRHVYFKIARELIGFYDVEQRYFLSFISSFLNRVYKKFSKLFFLSPNE